jgi:hypothetical protein
MDLLLLPRNSQMSLQDVYRRALSQSTHLYIVSAYLTHWDIQEELSRQCESFKFIVGKDFGLTRKAACQHVLNWLPEERHEDFLAAEEIDGFHPKAVFWREQDGTCHALLGSSNLSKAAFSSNHEVNGYSKITRKTFDGAEQWINQLARKCVTLDANWLALYREAVQPRKPKPAGEKDDDRQADDRVFDLVLPNPKELMRHAAVLVRRRQQMQLFAEFKTSLENHFRSAARAKVWDADDSLHFYITLNELWSLHIGNRFQGLGWERQGRGSNFQELSKSMVSVLDARDLSRDRVVKVEIDRLRQLDVNTRGALFSEMLCQFFPDQYHVLNKPIKSWLQDTGIAHVRGATQGADYIRSARLLRAALNRAKKYPVKNLAELDALIWLQSNPDSPF